MAIIPTKFILFRKNGRLRWGHGPEATIHHAAASVAAFMPSLASFMTWRTSAGIAAIPSILIGAFVDLSVKHVVAPAFSDLKSR
jgi:hypothetical protein